MRRRRRVVRAALCAAALLAFAAGTHESGRLALAQSPTAPSVTIDAPQGNDGVCDNQCLRGFVTLRATPTPSTGRAIRSVAFQYSLAGANAWQPIFTASVPPYQANFDSGTAPDGGAGVYDFRAVATDSAGEQSAAVARDRVFANNAIYVSLVDPGPQLPGTVTLQTKSPPLEVADPDQATFQYSPAGEEKWTDIGTDTDPSYDAQNRAVFSVDLNSRELSGGRYDLRVVPGSLYDPSVRFVSRPLRDRVVDATPPTASLSLPPQPLSGVVTLTADAQDAGGIASVQFERAPAGSDSWTAFGRRIRAPYSLAFDTRALQDGAYDFRVIAVDKAGNAGHSPLVANVAVRNPGRVPAGERSVTSVVAPAGNLHLLGATGDGATWAWGFTRAAPAVVDGRPLPYTERGNQLVLLRYTEAGGWQIRDVLRDEAGAPFALRANIAVLGQMTASGEAWIALKQTGAGGQAEGALFHRSPGLFGGQFRSDLASSAQLAPLLQTMNGSDRLEVAETGDGRVYGMLTSSQQNQTTATSPDGGSYRRRLAYGILDGGTWQRKTLPAPRGYTPQSGDAIDLVAGDLTAPGAGWAAVRISGANGTLPPRIGRLGDGPWDPIVTGVDVLDQTDAFAVKPPDVAVTQVHGDRNGVWIGATAKPASGGGSANLVAYYDEASHEVTRSWCGPLDRPSLGCGAPLDLDHPAAVPDAEFETASGTVAVALQENFISTYRYGEWSRAAAPGFAPRTGNALFTSPDEGWLGGTSALGRVSAAPPPDPLATWPQANRSTLLSVALPPGSDGKVGEAGALAVGLDGTALGYDAAAGWQVLPTPAHASRQALRAVAFSGPSQAFAVGGAGIILRWDGAAWTEDPQSTRITTSELQSVAFNAGGEGWAVGRFGTLLHYDGSSWSAEQPPPEYADSGMTIGSVTVAGDDVFAIAGGNLIERGSGGQWRVVPRSELPDEPSGAPLPFDGDLRVVSGLPDGGVVAAGRSVVLARRRPSARFEYAAQPIEGIAVAASAFRDGDGVVRAFVVSAPPAAAFAGQTKPTDLAGFPAGDGTLLRQTAGGWVDLSHNQPPVSRNDVTDDGLVKPDPVLAVAAGPAGDRAWAVGGYAGTVSAAGQGTYDVLSARAPGWRTAHVWRYDAGGSAQSPADVPAAVTVPERPDTVTFAFLSYAQCRVRCSATQDAQPDVHLKAAAQAIDDLSRQPGGPAFAVFGGNARGPAPGDKGDVAWRNGNGKDDFAELPRLLAPLRNIPLFAAYGPRDAVPRIKQPAQPWADAFAQSPAPFGSRAAPAGITPVDSGPAVGAVHRYYAFDAEQNGAIIRGIVLDNSSTPNGPPLDGAQDRWLTAQLSDAQATGRPIVIFLGQPLKPSDFAGDLDLTSRFMQAGVAAIFGGDETDAVSSIPVDAPAEQRIPQFTGGSMGYQRAQNNGVTWDLVSINVRTRFVQTDAIPLTDSLALKPLLGLTVNRSSTLAFDAIGRRPVGTLATSPTEPTFPGIDNYVSIPAPSCGACTGPSYAFSSPSYSFSSSDPTIGDFVQASGPGSRFPRLDSHGSPIHSSRSGLFCAYNSGSTTVSVTVGTRQASLPVTVLAGGFGRPCGTVFRAGVQPVIVRPSTRTVRQSTAPGGSGAPTAPPSSPPNSPPATLPAFKVPFPAPPVPAPAKHPAPPPPPPPAIAQPAQVILEPAPISPTAMLSIPPVTPPPIPPNIQPIPPGGSASAQAAARRKEKARKHASQSAFSTHTPGEPWFYGAVGVMTVLTLLLVAGGVRPDPRRRPAPALLRLDQRRR